MLSLFDGLRVWIGLSFPVAAAGARAFMLEAGLEVVPEASEADVWLLDDAALADPDTLSDAPGAVVGLGSPVWAAALAELNLSGWAALPPDATPMEVVAGVLAAASGLAAVSAAQASFFEMEEGDTEPEPLPDSFGDIHLTPREHQVLELLSAGLSNKRAAKQLGVSEHTVKFHAQAIYSKFGVQSRAAAVTRGVQLGLLSV